MITGPSGVGKTTAAKRLLARRPTLRRLVTYTTRPMRPGERDGVDYHFTSESEFKRMIDAGELFEWDHHYEHYYGNRTSDLNTLLADGFDVLMVLDVNGARTVKQKRTDAVLLCLQTESLDILLKRLEKRDSGQTTGWEERRQAIEKEMEFAKQCEFTITSREGDIEGTIDEIERAMGRG